MDAASVTQLTAVEMEWRGRSRDQPGTEALPFPGKEGWEKTKYYWVEGPEDYVTFKYNATKVSRTRR